MSLFGLVSLILVISYLPVYSDQKISQMPSQENWLSLFLFYLAIFLTLTGFFALVLLWLQRKIGSEQLALERAVTCFRQGLLLSLMVVMLLVLQSFRILVWWDGLLVFGFVLLLEMYFISR